MPTPWPEELPMKDGLEVLKAVAKRDIKSVESLAANCGWVGLGYGLSYRFPLDVAPIGDAPQPPELTTEEGIAILESNLAGEGAQAIPPIVVFQLAMLLYRIAKRFDLIP